jgi:ketosteroid isomerase-like protein
VPAAIVVLAGTAAASDRSDVIAVVQAFNDAATKEAYQSYCTDDAVIVDHVPPFVFRGPKACEAEWDADVAWAVKNKFSLQGAVQKASAPVFFTVDGDQAYAVFPVKASWLTHERRRDLETLYATFALRRQGDSWRVANMAWASLGWRLVPPSRRP